MSGLTDAVNALSTGVHAHGEVIVSRMNDLQSDFALVQAKLEAALANDAEAAEAVARINAATSAIAASGTTLSTLDLDPSNPTVPPPAEEPPVEEPPVVVDTPTDSPSPDTPIDQTPPDSPPVVVDTPVVPSPGEESQGGGVSSG